jgi:ligand-binding SRPBCC domain-containing protein
MRILLKSRVSGNYLEVGKSFDRNLFEFLLPPGAKVQRFDGSRKGDIVHLAFTFPFKAEWVSEIIEDNITDRECFFIDKGTKLPFGIRSWIHKHRIVKDDNHSIIEDDIEFSTGNRLLDLVYYPGLLISFLPRKWQYRKYFTKSKK